MITGPSGSGKSSLAFDTIYAEGQRQYIESLSIYARKFLHQMERPDVDLIEGLQPTLCIDQRPGTANPRSTVATVTEIYDYLRVLMARLGVPHCYACGHPICQQNPEQIQQRLLTLPEQTKLMLMSPVVRGRKGKHAEAFVKIRKAGFVRVRVDTEIYDVDQPPDLAPGKLHTIEAIVDRIVVKPAARSRLGESIQLALRHSDGLLVAVYLDEAAADEAHPHGVWREELFSTRYACPNCEISYEELEPRTFSFNSAYGACPDCEGLGSIEQFDRDAVLPDTTRSLDDGAIAPWRDLTQKALKKYQKELARFLAAHKLDWQTPLDNVPAKTVDRLLYGDGKSFLGVMTMLEKELATTTKRSRQELLETFRSKSPCRACQGTRLRPEALGVRLHEHSIADFTRLTVAEALRQFEGMGFTAEQSEIAEPLVTEIVNRLSFLQKVGVHYLTLDRPADSLSGGELQRVRLATGIGSGLVGVCYVLDEPSIGLHPRDNDRLIQALRELQQLGNSVLVVEHDEAMMRASDQLIDVGPQAGMCGGRIVAQGAISSLNGSNDSVTARYLTGQACIPVPAKRRKVIKKQSLVISGVTTNNLKNISVRVPLGALVCVTGVSGSGKSSLINATLTRALTRRLGGAASPPGPFQSLTGTALVDKVIEIDQSPIGRTPRSNAATYTGMFDEIRKIFAGSRDAKQYGFKASRFSFNVKGGRCETCQGQGTQKIEMSFLPDLYVTCDVCGGSRFNRQTLQVKYREKSIADVLELPVDEAVGFFENFSNIHRTLLCLRDVGLGYLTLGQPSTTLSGGEAQRIKLATQLARVDTGKTIYMLDEPTTGLHFDDVRQLLDVLGKLVDRGNSVVVIEHNLDVIKSADWIIDLGPEGGAAGGAVVAEGTPEDVVKVPASHTGRCLAGVL